jgi:hypothetical protein
MDETGPLGQRLALLEDSRRLLEVTSDTCKLAELVQTDGDARVVRHAPRNGETFFEIRRRLVEVALMEGGVT